MTRRSLFKVLAGLPVLLMGGKTEEDTFNVFLQQHSNHKVDFTWLVKDWTHKRRIAWCHTCNVITEGLTPWQPM